MACLREGVKGMSWGCPCHDPSCLPRLFLHVQGPRLMRETCVQIVVMECLTMSGFSYLDDLSLWAMLEWVNRGEQKGHTTNVLARQNQSNKQKTTTTRAGDEFVRCRCGSVEGNYFAGVDMLFSRHVMSPCADHDCLVMLYMMSARSLLPSTPCHQGNGSGP